MMQVVRQELEVSAMIAHPFIPKYYDLIENKHFIIKFSEYIQG